MSLKLLKRTAQTMHGAKAGGAKKRRSSWVGRVFGRLASSLGLSGSSRKVRFQNATIYEFERQLLGGGGVPDGDAVALGLGPRYALSTILTPMEHPTRCLAPAPFVFRPTHFVFRSQMCQHLPLASL